MRLIPILLIVLVLSSCTIDVKTSSSSPFPITSRSVNFEIGSADTQVDRFTSLLKLKKEVIKVSYYPVEDLVCLQFRNDFITFYQYWYVASRQAFISSLERYKTDYDSRNLPKKSSSSRAYSRVKSYLVWETTRFSIPGRSFPNINIGYIIKDNSPYFTVSQMESPNVEPQSKEGNPRNAKQILYFTRAQADNLAALFDQDYLRSLNAPVNIITDNSPDKENF